MISFSFKFSLTNVNKSVAVRVSHRIEWIVINNVYGIMICTEPSVYHSVPRLKKIFDITSMQNIKARYNTVVPTSCIKRSKLNNFS